LDQSKLKVQNYYVNQLSADKLQRCYDLAPARVQQYLKAEINHVYDKIKPGERLLELGCGYGRVIPQFAARAGFVIGIDTSKTSISKGQKALNLIGHCHLLVMNAIQLGFPDQSFDRVICIQNGISAFHIDPRKLILEVVRVTKLGGSTIFSSYADEFWPYRLEWFKLQAAAGLIGEIDINKTGNGIIVCKDGFTATDPTPKNWTVYKLSRRGYNGCRKATEGGSIWPAEDTPRNR